MAHGQGLPYQTTIQYEAEANNEYWLLVSFLGVTCLLLIANARAEVPKGKVSKITIILILPREAHQISKFT